MRNAVEPGIPPGGELAAAKRGEKFVHNLRLGSVRTRSYDVMMCEVAIAACHHDMTNPQPPSLQTGNKLTCADPTLHVAKNITDQAARA
jgi:hypothetical protein